MERRMGLQIGLLAFPDVQLLDLAAPYEVFAAISGATTHLLWKDVTPVRSSSGLELTPTTRLDDCPALDVLCVPGGSGVNALLSDEVVLDFIRRQSARARYTTAVCTGALLLGMAGLLKGRRATTHWNALDFLPRFGAVAVEACIVEDGNLITAGGVTSGIDFGLAVAETLIGRLEAEIIQLTLEYDPQPPFQAGTPRTAGAEVLSAAKTRLARSRATRDALIPR
jgi:cyclohexyl-isocyanide hydratase